MITKVLQSNDLRATLDYIYQEGKDPMVVDSTCMDDSREGALADIRDYIEQRPEISKPVFHAVLSVPEHERMDDLTWKKIAEEYTRKMGYGDVPYVAVRHQDTAHQHIHIVASRVTMKGQLISDSFEAYRSQEVARVLEKTHELTRVPSSWEVDRCRARPEELHRAMRLGEPAQRERMHQAIEESLRRTQSVTQFVQALHKHDVRVVPNVTQDESKVQGISFEREGVKLAGSKIDRQFSWNQLKDRLDYSHARDLETLRRTPETPHLTRALDAPSSPLSSPESSRPERLHATVPMSPVASPTLNPVTSRDDAPAARSVSAGLVQVPPPESSRVMPDDPQRIAMALARAPEDRGWKAWTDSLKRDGVEAVPKVTQQDHANVRGMYFVSGEAMLPGSHVAREYSFAQLQARLGTYEPTRDAESFARVMVPGRGLEARQREPDLSPTQHPSSEIETPALAASNRAAEALAQRFEARGYRVILEPDSYKGHWRAEVQDAQGQSYGLLTKTISDSSRSSSKELALVALYPTTKLVEAHEEDGKIRAHAVLSNVSELRTGDDVVWKRGEDQRALIRVSQGYEKEVLHPVSMPQQSPPSSSPPPQTSSEERLVERFEKGGYTVQVNPARYEGYWRTEVKDDAGSSYALLTRTPSHLPSEHAHKEIALVRVDASLQLVEAHRDQGRLVADRRLSGLDELRQDHAIVVSRTASTHAMFRVPSHSKTQSASLEPAPVHVSTPSTQSTEPPRPQSPKPAPLTQDAWVESMRRQGIDGRILASGESAAGKVMGTPVRLKEGEFTAIDAGSKHIVLVPRTVALDSHADKQVLITRGEHHTLTIKSLERDRDRGMSR